MSIPTGSTTDANGTVWLPGATTVPVLPSASAVVVPLSAVPAQIVRITLSGQQFILALAQKSTGLFINVYAGGVLVIGGVLCLNNMMIVRSPYLGVAGDFCFIDAQGAQDPTYDGLGVRYFLTYTPATS